MVTCVNHLTPRMRPPNDNDDNYGEYNDVDAKIITLTIPQTPST